MFFEHLLFSGLLLLAVYLPGLSHVLQAVPPGWKAGVGFNPCDERRSLADGATCETNKGDAALKAYQTKSPSGRQ